MKERKKKELQISVEDLPISDITGRSGNAP